MDMEMKNHHSWIMKEIMNQRESIHRIQQMWDNMVVPKVIDWYTTLIDDGQRAVWRKLITYNKARPRAVMCLWLACRGKLATKDRLKRFNLIQDSSCVLCNQAEEIVNHLLFGCRKTNIMWKEVLVWLGSSHVPSTWDAELPWIINSTKRKGWRATIMRMAIDESVYFIWKYRNDIIFDNHLGNTNIVDNIKDSVV